jgi:hypothetical protein
VKPAFSATRCDATFSGNAWSCTRASPRVRSAHFGEQPGRAARVASAAILSAHPVSDLRHPCSLETERDRPDKAACRCVGDHEGEMGSVDEALGGTVKTGAGATPRLECGHPLNMNYFKSLKPPESRNAAPQNQGQCAVSTEPGAVHSGL